MEFLSVEENKYIRRHNKSANGTFSHNFLAKRTGSCDRTSRHWSKMTSKTKHDLKKLLATGLKFLKPLAGFSMLN